MMNNAKSSLSPVIFIVAVLLPVAVSALLILPAITPEPAQTEPGHERAEPVATSDTAGPDKQAG